MPVEFIDQANILINSVKGKISTLSELQPKAIELAALLLEDAQKQQTPLEKKHFEQLARMLRDPRGKFFTVAMVDQCFRSRNSLRTADQLCYLIKKFGIPKYLSMGQKITLRFFSFFGKLLAPITVPLIKRFIYKTAHRVILPGEKERLSKYLKRRQKDGIQINLNRLGEAILSEEEAEKRLQIYLEDLKNPQIHYISIKISTLYSQLNWLAWNQTLEKLSERLRQLYRMAQTHPSIKSDGTSQPKFVNLDMEEYRDLHLTVALFQRVLSEPEFHHLSAGIVLQSYVPDSFQIQQKLTSWASERFLKGGAPIKIRLVKGANLAMEKVEASLHDWPQAPYLTKQESDANYKRMIEFGSLPARAKAAHLGIGSHNLFDIALAMLVRSQNNIEPYMSFEMLEGMADHLSRVVHKVTGGIILYAPASTKEDFQNAIAYLTRRLDENTAPENFLHDIFGLRPNSSEWETQTELFSKSIRAIEYVKANPTRQQDRHLTPLKPDGSSPFGNEPDTDWSLPQNVLWGEETIQISHSKELEAPFINTKEALEKIVQTASQTFHFWSSTSIFERSCLLANIAQELRANRQKLIQAMTLNTHKSIPEADSEVSEAIDFAEYYRRNIEELHCFDDIGWEAKGIVLVASPWNFPCSIPAGGLLSALATGHCVLFKPAPEAILVGWLLAQSFWAAGVSKEVLQFVACEDEPLGSELVQDLRIATLVLTGSTETAKLFLRMRPSMNLLAETGGKNTMIITNLADRDLAIKDLLHSAFSYSGQKCSACSLAILESEIYDDPHFLRQLRNAASSLAVGSSFNLSSKVTPLIKAPNQVLYRALTQLEEGEEWLLKPERIPYHPHLWSPGIKIGVKPNSFTHQTEFFGPILGVMRATSLEHAIELANGTPYGLTAGLQTLDDREKEVWMNKIEAGNGYINRSTTGAIVQRQPFGGYKASSFGPGAKAGGPNYLIPFMTAKETALPRNKAPLNANLQKLSEFVHKLNLSAENLELWKASAHDYAFYWQMYFSQKHDPSQRVGEDNFLRYLPYSKVLLYVHKHDSIVDILRIIAAALTVKCPLYIHGDSQQLEFLHSLSKIPDFNLKVSSQNEHDILPFLRHSFIKQVRFLSLPDEGLQRILAEEACSVTVASVLGNGRIELLRFLQEQSLSIVYHRYGNISR